MLRRAGGRPIRLASKSIRCRALLERTLASDPGFRGTLAFTLPEALWLADHGLRDLVVAYPTADRAALRALAAREDDAGIAVMVDDVAHWSDRACGRGGRAATGGAAAGGGPPGGAAASDGGARPIRVCIDVDASWRPLGGRVHVGAKRSPLHAPAQAAALAREIAARPALQLVGLMAYEAQIAGRRRPPARQAADGPRAARDAARLGARAGGAARGDRRGRRGGRAAGARQRRRHRQPRADGRRAGRHRDRRRLGPLRADAVRRLLALHAAAGGAVRAAGRAATGPRRRDRARRRLPRVRIRRPRTAAAPGPAGRPEARRPRGRRRGADAAAGRRRRRPARSATASGSATRRPASCASASPSCT